MPDSTSPPVARCGFASKALLAQKYFCERSSASSFVLKHLLRTDLTMRPGNSDVRQCLAVWCGLQRPTVDPALTCRRTLCDRHSARCWSRNAGTGSICTRLPEYGQCDTRCEQERERSASQGPHGRIPQRRTATSLLRYERTGRGIRRVETRRALSNPEDFGPAATFLHERLSAARSVRHRRE